MSQLSKTDRIKKQAKTNGKVVSDVAETVDTPIVNDPKSSKSAEPKPTANPVKASTTSTETETKAETETETETKAEAKAEAETEAGTASAAASDEPTRSKANVVIPLLLAGILVIGMAGLGWFMAERQPDVYSAKAELILETSDARIDRFIATQTVLVKSSRVLNRVTENSDVALEDLINDVDVSPIEGGIALAISYRSEDPEEAVEVVNGVLESYLLETGSNDLASVRDVYVAQIEQFEAERAELEDRLARIETANAAADAAGTARPNPTEERRLGVESTQLLTQIGLLEQQVLTTDVQLLNQSKATVVSEARLEEGRVAPTPPVYAALGALAGGLIAVGAMLAMGLRRRG